MKLARGVRVSSKSAIVLRYIRHAGRIVTVVSIGSFVYTASQQGLEAASEEFLRDALFVDEFRDAAQTGLTIGTDMLNNAVLEDMKRPLGGMASIRSS